jgi:hypothetical protein
MCKVEGGARRGALGDGEEGGGLLYLTVAGGGCLATLAGGVDGLGRDEVQVLVVRDLV